MAAQALNLGVVTKVLLDAQRSGSYGCHSRKCVCNFANSRNKELTRSVKAK